MAVRETKYDSYRVDVYAFGKLHKVGQFKSKEQADKIFTKLSQIKGSSSQEFFDLLNKIKQLYGKRCVVEKGAPVITKEGAPVVDSTESEGAPVEAIKKLGRSWDNIIIQPFSIYIPEEVE